MGSNLVTTNPCLQSISRQDNKTYILSMCSRGFSNSCPFLRESLTPYILISLLSSILFPGHWTLCLASTSSSVGETNWGLQGPDTKNVFTASLITLYQPCELLRRINEDILVQVWIKSHLHSQTKNKSVFHCDCIKGRKGPGLMLLGVDLNFYEPDNLKGNNQNETMVIILLENIGMGPHYILVSDSGK